MAQCINAVDLRHHDIENDGIEFTRKGARNAVPAVKYCLDPEALGLQIFRQHFSQVDIVIDKKNACAAALCFHKLNISL